jgi:peptidoglycan/LPS O-acetylase OafA/YrhL
VTYVLRNLQVLVLPLPFSQLPGLRIENGSLWTLPVEICCYLLLLCGWVICRHAGLKSRLDLIVSGIATLVAGLALWRYAQTAGLHLAWMFTSGVLAHYLQARIKLSFRVAVVGLVVLVLSSSHRMAFQAAVLLVVPYLVLCASYLPGGRIRSFNRLGDYSYGVYIYGAPVQFSVLHLAPSAGVLAHVAMVVPIVIAVAAVSWHVVEKPSLRAVPRIVAALRRSMTPKAAPVGA